MPFDEWDYIQFAAHRKKVILHKTVNTQSFYVIFKLIHLEIFVRIKPVSRRFTEAQGLTPNKGWADRDIELFIVNSVKTDSK